MFKPVDCRFGLCDDYETDFHDCSVAVLLSAVDASDNLWIEDVEADMIEGFPVWLKDRREAECFYAAPKGWTLERTKMELEKIGFAHEPAWDEEYGA